MIQNVPKNNTAAAGWVVVGGDPWKGVVVREVLGGEEGDPPSPVLSILLAR